MAAGASPVVNPDISGQYVVTDQRYATSVMRGDIWLPCVVLAPRKTESGSGCAQSRDQLKCGATQADNAVSLNDDMTFSAQLSGMNCSCLLDTGSTISLVSKAVFDILPNQPKLSKTATVAKTASRESLPLLGRTVLSFRVGNVVSTVPMYVSDRIDVPCLLGLDFLQACPCVIDLTRRRLVLTPAESVRSVSAEAVSVGTVVLSQSVSVPPGHEMILTGRVPNGDYQGPALLEPTLTIQGLECVRGRGKRGRNRGREEKKKGRERRRG